MISYHIDADNDKTEKNGDVFSFPYPCFSHQNCSPFSILLRPGVYFVELWGAQGGNRTDRNIPGGKGGFVSGFLGIRKRTKLFLFVGASGIEKSNESVFGGGGKGSASPGGSGGGATDLRFSENDFSSRIMVAAGGAGSTFVRINLPGGDAGGISGFDGVNVVNSTEIALPGCGGKQNESYSSSCNSGAFGYGNDSNPNYGTGGGGGYYGGGGGDDKYLTVSSGGGGSSYVSGHPECKKNHLAVLRKPLIFSGRDSFPSPDGVTRVGNIGNGFARITFCAPYEPFTCRVSFAKRFCFSLINILLSHK